MGYLLNELLNSSIVTRTKAFTCENTVIFFDKNKIVKSIKSSWVPMKRFKEFKNSQKKLNKRNIAYYYYNDDELKNINNDEKEITITFDNMLEPSYNELYFKLINYDTSHIKYYSYNEFIQNSENYNYDTFVYLFSKFGLKVMSWCYTNNIRKFSKIDNTFDLGIENNNFEIKYANINENKESIGLQGEKEFQNNGSLPYFNCCDMRTDWYNYTKFNIEEVVKDILDSNSMYSYEYYKKNDLLKKILQNRLMGSLKISHEISVNTHHTSLVHKMTKISNKFGHIGISFNNENINIKNYTKKYELEFWDNEILELKTLEQLIGNDNLLPGIRFNIIDKANTKYQKLYNKHVSNLENEMSILQDRLLFERNKFGECSKKLHINTVRKQVENKRQIENRKPVNVFNPIKDPFNSNIGFRDLNMTI